MIRTVKQERENRHPAGKMHLPKPSLNKNIKQRIATNKRMGRGYIEINDWFEGSNGHHINNDYVIYITHELHNSIGHSQDNIKSMRKINYTIFWIFYYLRR